MPMVVDPEGPRLVSVDDWAERLVGLIVREKGGARGMKGEGERPGLICLWESTEITRMTMLPTEKFPFIAFGPFRKSTQLRCSLSVLLFQSLPFL